MERERSKEEKKSGKKDIIKDERNSEIREEKDRVESGLKEVEEEVLGAARNKLQNEIIGRN